MFTVQDLIKLTEPKPQNEKFWVGSDGKKHAINGSVNSAIVGGFTSTKVGSRRYIGGQALYYKV